MHAEFSGSEIAVGIYKLRTKQDLSEEPAAGQLKLMMRGTQTKEKETGRNTSGVNISGRLSWPAETNHNVLLPLSSKSA